MLCVTALSPGYGCKESKPPVEKKPESMTSVNVVTPVNNDEQQFRQFLKQFKAAAKQKNLAQLSGMFQYPVQTSPQWSNDDLHNMAKKPVDGLMDKPELQKHFDDVFSGDALRLIPKSGDNDLSEIDKATAEDYYKELVKKTDKGSTLYELNIQYTQDNNKETSFGFVFGRVNGSYKILSYFRPWPLK